MGESNAAPRRPFRLPEGPAALQKCANRREFEPCKALTRDTLNANLSPSMPNSKPKDAFPTTHWTMVQVVQGEDKELAAVALETLCKRYWYPVYAYLRRSGISAEDAEDLAQMTFQKLVADETLRYVRQERGRLRTFLVGLIRQVISHKNRHDRAEKRGGGAPILSLEEAGARDRYSQEPADLLDPQRLYEHAWAMQVLETVREKLRSSFIKNGRLQAWEAVEPHLGWDEEQAPFAELGTRLNSNETAARVLVHRLRKKFRDLLEEEISLTVASPEDVPRELDWFRSVLRR